MRKWLPLALAIALFGHLVVATAAPRPSVQAADASPKEPAPALQATPMPLDPKLVTYPYDRNYTYPIVTSANKETHIELGDDETIQGIYLVDSQIQWRMVVSKPTMRDVFFTPVQNGLSQTGTIITTKRRYEIKLVSQDDAHYFQRISWQYDDFGNGIKSGGLDVGVEFTAPVAPAGGGRHGTEPEIDVSDTNSGHIVVNLQHAHFGYTIEGDAPFKPSMVFDDGKFTYIRFDPQPQSLPGPFLLSKDGKAETVQFVPKDGYFMIQRLSEYGILLQLNDQKVKIYPPGSKACGFFGCSSKTPTNMVGTGGQ
jgi:type IV secretion system protein VirB9